MRHAKACVFALLLFLALPAFSWFQLPGSPQALLPPVVSPWGQWGARLASAGDVNNDGFDDLLVTGHLVHDYESTDDVYLYLGSPEGIRADNPIHVVSIDPLNSDTTLISGAGDVDGDGYDDVLVANPQMSGGPPWWGSTLLYRGTATGLEADPAWSASWDYDTGRRMKRAGDVNHDGYGDVVITGSFMEEGAQYSSEAALVFLGSPTGLALTPANVLLYEQVNSRFASGYAPAGDVNHDGYDDLVVYAETSSWSWDDPVKKALFLYLGGPEGLSETPAWTVDAFGEPEYPLSYCEIAVGDLNHDGNPDLVFGVPLYSDETHGNEGKVFVYFGDGTAFSSTPGWSHTTHWMGAYYGESVATGDFNGDGYDDLLTGGGQYGMNFVGEEAEETVGGVFYFAGGPDGLPEEPTWIGRGKPVDFFGRIMAPAGDVNGDGIADFAVTSLAYDNVQVSDTVLVYLGAPDVEVEKSYIIPPLCFIGLLESGR